MLQISNVNTLGLQNRQGRGSHLQHRHLRIPCVRRLLGVVTKQDPKLQTIRRQLKPRRDSDKRNQMMERQILSGRIWSMVRVFSSNGAPSTAVLNLTHFLSRFDGPHSPLFAACLQNQINGWWRGFNFFLRESTTRIFQQEGVASTRVPVTLFGTLYIKRMSDFKNSDWLLVFQFNP